MRIRLYINREDARERAGLYYGSKKRTRVCGDIWRGTSIRIGEGWTPVWHAFYHRDKASPSDPWYTLDINKFAVLT